MNTIRVKVFEPGKRGEVREVENELTALQTIVGGYIEAVPFERGLCVLCNDHGRIESLHNRFGFYGTFLVVRVKGEEFVSLTDEDLPGLFALPGER